jgi:hypothetical protein
MINRPFFGRCFGFFERQAMITEQKIDNTVPEHICAVIMACLSKNPKHRPKKGRFIMPDAW